MICQSKRIFTTEREIKFTVKFSWNAIKSLGQTNKQKLKSLYFGCEDRILLQIWYEWGCPGFSRNSWEKSRISCRLNSKSLFSALRSRFPGWSWDHRSRGSGTACLKYLQQAKFTFIKISLIYLENTIWTHGNESLFDVYIIFGRGFEKFDSILFSDVPTALLWYKPLVIHITLITWMIYKNMKKKPSRAFK